MESTDAIAGSAQRWRVNSSVNCTPGEYFAKSLVDAELEIEGAVLVPQHDRGRDRRVAGMERDDLALAGLGQRRGGATDEGGVTFVLQKRGAARALPAAGFECEEGFERGCDVSLRSGNFKTNGAVPGEAVALPAQLLQFLGAERLGQ